MLKILRKALIKYTPKQFKSIDEMLVSTSPVLWSTQSHSILFYCLVVGIAYGGISLFLPANLGTAVYSWVLIVVFAIISVTAILVWFYFLMKYDFRKAHGKHSIISDLNYCLVCFLGFFLVITLWVGPTWHLANRFVAFAGGLTIKADDIANAPPSDDSSLQSYVELQNALQSLDAEWCFIFLLTTAFYLLIAQSATTLFGFKRLIKSSGVLLAAFYLLAVIVEFIKFVIVDALDLHFSAFFNDSSGAYSFIFFLLLCALAIWYLQKSRIYSSKYFSLWLFVTVTVPILISEIGFILMEQLEMDASNSTGKMLIVLFSLLFLAFLPWQRSMIYKLYSLPK